MWADVINPKDKTPPGGTDMHIGNIATTGATDKRVFELTRVSIVHSLTVVARMLPVAF